MRNRLYGEIDLHADHLEPPKMAVNVKTHGMDFPSVEGESDELRNRAWDITAEIFWRNANDVAHKHGYAHVFAEGRSEGWCVPFYQTATVKGKTVTQFGWNKWPGQGGDHGYPSYPDVNDPKERRRFIKFQREIKRLMASMTDEFKHQLEMLVEDEREAA